MEEILHTNYPPPETLSDFEGLLARMNTSLRDKVKNIAPWIPKKTE